MQLLSRVHSAEFLTIRWRAIGNDSKYGWQGFNMLLYVPILVNSEVFRCRIISSISSLGVLGKGLILDFRVRPTAPLASLVNYQKAWAAPPGSTSENQVFDNWRHNRSIVSRYWSRHFLPFMSRNIGVAIWRDPASICHIIRVVYS